ncbi:ATP-binding cassette domain-containing protein [Rhodohalobacter sp.]|uniref:ABC transporter ATP-binding protein n=1 Tax=Rhodohalobacter sp. TaxID=1974210 RepID=UPI003566EB8D
MIEISANNISKKYGRKRVLNGISFLHQTTVLGIAGANGSGKSTLLKIISGLLKPTSGKIQWEIFEDTLQPKAIIPYIGFSAPYVQLYEELTVEENLRFLVELQKNSSIEDINDLLHRFEIKKLQNSLYGNLSTGQQQRVKLASAVIKKPSILIMDEPGSNLDQKGKSLIKNLVQTFRDSKKMVIIASNQQDELDLCDKTIDLNNFK